MPRVLDQAAETVENARTGKRPGGGARELRDETRSLPTLLTVPEAGKLLRVSDATVRSWIEADSIPYVKLPSPRSRKQYRIPLHGLLSSLEGTYDLRTSLVEQNARMRDADLPED
jgi:excisionase family DNA binding protein